MINKNSCSPNPEICEKPSHLRYQTWSSRDHLIDANTFARSIVIVLSNQTFFPFQASWFAMSCAKDVRLANQKPVFEFSKFSVEFSFFGQSDHHRKRRMVHLVMQSHKLMLIIVQDLWVRNVLKLLSS
jgi:hypothetical protein